MKFQYKDFRDAMKILVVPTIREESIKVFLDTWNRRQEMQFYDHKVCEWDQIIIIEDNPEKTFDVKCNLHASWKEIEEDLGKDSWIISKRDSAIRSYGFLKAYQMGADYIFTLDDDCLPDNENENFCLSHINAMENTTKWKESIVATKTRGFPYKNLGKLNNVVASMGLWKGSPDWDSIQQLSGSMPKFDLPKASQIMPIGQYFPLCGMNFAFKREMTPLSFFPIMGENSPYKRFDDIWFGIIFKKICDHLNLLISVGKPFVNHTRASNPMTNLAKEAPGIVANERFWQLVDSYQLIEKTPKDCMIEIGQALEKEENEYFSKLGRAIQIWCNLY